MAPSGGHSDAGGHGAHGPPAGATTAFLEAGSGAGKRRLPVPAPSPSVLAACREWAGVIGDSAVVLDPSELQRRARTTLPRAPGPVAVVRPSERRQVPELVRIAGRHRIPLYPSSTGCNWGWGEACPPTDGQALLDLGGLARIAELDEELGYVAIEPGVTQGQLARRLEGTPWILDCTSAGPRTSVLAVTIERGIGTGALSERFAAVAGMEVVLGDGSVVRTGFHHHRQNNVRKALRWGVGPSLDGLFSQSNLGIVTELGIWLAPRPEVARAWFLTIPDEQLEATVDALRTLRLYGWISGAPHLFPVPGPGGRRWWLSITAMAGSRAWSELAEREIAAAVGDTGRSIVFAADDFAETGPGPLLAALGLPDEPTFQQFLAAGASFARGHPLQFSPAFVLSYVGGAGQRDDRPPTSPDPLDEGYGFFFLWPASAAVGREVRRGLRVLEPILQEHGRGLAMTLSMPNARTVVFVTRIWYERSDPEDVRRGERCWSALFDAMPEAGFPHARCGILGMDRLDPDGSGYWETVRRLKQALDPEGALAPGRYLPSVDDGSPSGSV